MNLTAHVTLEELVHSDTAVRLGINNTPPMEVVERLRTTAHGLEWARDILNARGVSTELDFERSRAKSG